MEIHSHFAIRHSQGTKRPARTSAGGGAHVFVFATPGKNIGGETPTDAISVFCRALGTRPRLERQAHIYRRSTAGYSDEALAAVVARRPNLVFLDIWLKGSRLDGLQLLDSLKQQHSELPIVMISGHGNIETAVSVIKRGAYDFIEKPFKADRLLLVAERALRELVP
jgi:ActR/RegA family two-component response regulator